MTVAYRVQSAPGREGARERLLALLPPAVEVVVDDGSPANGDWLVPPAGPWRGYCKCLTEPPDCTHLAIVQDDAVPCPNFGEAVELISSLRPDSVVCLFVPGSALRTVHQMRQAALSRRSFVEIGFRDFMPVVAVLWPIDSARSLLEWSRTAQLPGMPRPPQSDDAVAGQWMRETRASVIATIPSLVEHPDDVPSSIGFNAMNGLDTGRVAAMFIGDSDPLEIDWSA